MKYNNVLGIDPGANGAFVYIENIYADTPLVTSQVFPKDEPLLIYDLLSKLDLANTFCVLEQVGGMPNDGGSRAFNFGRNYGLIEMSLYAFKTKVLYVRPQEWQKAMFPVKHKKTTKTLWKNELKTYAQCLYGELKVTLKNADALLIAEYAKRRLLNS